MDDVLNAVQKERTRQLLDVNDGLEAQEVGPAKAQQRVQPAIEHLTRNRFVEHEADGADVLVMSDGLIVGVLRMPIALGTPVARSAVPTHPAANIRTLAGGVIKPETEQQPRIYILAQYRGHDGSGRIEDPQTLLKGKTLCR